ncbi:MAG: hypothetical protein WCS75_13800, partial [Sphingomonas sp.]
HQQISGNDAKRLCDPNKFVSASDDFAALDLGQADVGNFGQNRRKAKQFQKTRSAALVPQTIGEHDIAIRIDRDIRQIAQNGVCVCIVLCCALDR